MSREPFAAHADYYDRFYADKDYAGECDYIETVLARHGNGETKAILDLGCGTGGHLLQLAARGYHVHGVERSAEMLDICRRRIADTAIDAALHRHDLRQIPAIGTFDAAIAMFAVLGYVTDLEDLQTVFRGVRDNLRPGGLLLFDVWYIGAVLSMRPEARDRSLDGTSGAALTRRTRPRIDETRQIVELQIDVEETTPDGKRSATSETHTVRYFSIAELTLLLKAAGFSVRQVCPFLDLDSQVSSSDWNISVIAIAG